MALTGSFVPQTITPTFQRATSFSGQLQPAPGAPAFPVRPSPQPSLPPMGVLSYDSKGRKKTERKEIIRKKQPASPRQPSPTSVSGYKEIEYAYIDGRARPTKTTIYSMSGAKTEEVVITWASGKNPIRSSTKVTKFGMSGEAIYATTYGNLMGEVRQTTYESFGATPEKVTVTTKKDLSGRAWAVKDKALRDQLNLAQETETAYRQRSATSEAEYTTSFYTRREEEQAREQQAFLNWEREQAFGPQQTEDQRQTLGQLQYQYEEDLAGLGYNFIDITGTSYALGQKEKPWWSFEKPLKPQQPVDPVWATLRVGMGSRPETENVRIDYNPITRMATTVNRVNEDLISRGNFLRTTGEVEARNDIGVWMGLRSRSTTISPSDTRSPDYSGGMDVSQGTVYPTPEGDWLYKVEDLAGSIKVKQIRSDDTFTKMWYGAQQFGLGAVQGIVYPFKHPIEAVKGTWEFIKSPVQTAEAIGEQAVIYPEYTAGQFVGPIFLTKTIKGVRPVGRVVSYVERGREGFVPIEKTNINFVESFTSPIEAEKYVEFAGKEVTTIHVTQANFKFEGGKAVVRASEPGQAGPFRSQRNLFELYSSSPEYRTGKAQAYLGYTDIASGVQESGKIRFSFLSPQVTAIIERGVRVAEPTAEERAIVKNPSVAEYRRLVAERQIRGITNPQLAIENLAKQSTEGQFVTTPVTTELTLRSSKFTQYQQKVPAPAFVEQIGLGKAWEKSFLGSYPRKVILLDVERGPAPLAPFSVVDGGNVRFGFGPKMNDITYAEMASSLRSRYVTPAKAASLTASVVYPSQGVLSYSSPSFSSQMVGSLRVSSGSSRASGFRISYPSIGSLRISSSRVVPPTYSTPYVPPYKPPYSPPYSPPRTPPYTPPYVPPYKPPYSPPYSPPYKPPYYPPTPPKMPPFKPPKDMDFDFGGKVKGPRRRPTVRKYKYQPSLVAGAFNIRASKKFKKKRLTGVEVRPFL